MRRSPRREFLRFLAASPLAALRGQETPLNVLEFEELARKALPPAHWGYMTTGVDDDLTVRANREAMGHYQIRARRLAGGLSMKLTVSRTPLLPQYLVVTTAIRSRVGSNPGARARSRSRGARLRGLTLMAVSAAFTNSFAGSLRGVQTRTGFMDSSFRVG